MTNQSIPDLYHFATFAHFSLPSIHYFKENAHDFCFHLAYVVTAKLFDKTLEAPTQVGSSVRSTLPTLDHSVLTADQTPRAVLVLCRHCDGLSKHTHTHRNTHNQQLHKILTAQICTPTLAEVKGKLTEMYWVRNCFNINNKKNDSMQLCSLKGSAVRVALLSQDVLI